MPTQEDEKKSKVEVPKDPETPEQAAARAAGVAQEEKEKAAAAALAGVEIEGNATIETGSKPPIESPRVFSHPEVKRMKAEVEQSSRYLKSVQASIKNLEKMIPDDAAIQEAIQRGVERGDDDMTVDVKREKLREYLGSKREEELRRGQELQGLSKKYQDFVEKLQDLEAKAEAKGREVAQKYLGTIPESDRKLTSSKQVEDVLFILGDADDPRSHLFSISDKQGNLPARIITAQGKEERIAGWRAYAEDPIAIAAETDKLKDIAKSDLPESVRTALLSMILKEGEHPVTAMAKDVADGLEGKGGLTWKAVLDQYDSKRPEIWQDKILQQAAVRDFLEGLYPDHLKDERVLHMRDMSRRSDFEMPDKDAMAAIAQKVISAEKK